MTNKYNKVLYSGVTNNLIRRVLEHRNHFNVESFTAKYKLYKLVYYEIFQNSWAAINREKQIKGSSRIKKQRLISDVNPAYKDLFSEEDYEIASLRSQ